MSRIILKRPWMPFIYLFIAVGVAIPFGKSGVWMVDNWGLPVPIALVYSLGGVLCCAGPLSIMLAFVFGFNTFVKRTYYGAWEGDL